MNLTEHHLIVLAEEAAEIAHRASKQLRFGADEVQPGQPDTNRHRLREEVLDLMVCVDFLVESGQLAPISKYDIEVHSQHKREKINRMIAHSIEVGCLKP